MHTKHRIKEYKFILPKTIINLISIKFKLQLKIISILACISFWAYPSGAHPFDDVSQIPFEKSSIITVKEIKNGVEVKYSNGKIKRLENVNSPERGSPVTFIYKGIDERLEGYIIEVWRVGKQEVFLNKETGAHMELGYSRTISQDKKFVFSSDCWEIGCYYQINDWRNGERLYFKQESGSRHGYAMMDPIAESSMSWKTSKNIEFEVICSQHGAIEKIKVNLSLVSQKWSSSPPEPCSTIN